MIAQSFYGNVGQTPKMHQNLENHSQFQHFANIFPRIMGADGIVDNCHFYQSIDTGESMQLPKTSPQMSTALSHYSTPKRTNPHDDKRDDKRVFSSSRTFLPSKFKFNKRNLRAPKAHSCLSQFAAKQGSKELKRQAVSLVRLGEWLRVTTQAHGLGKNVFDLSVMTLKKVSSTMAPTYALAAASFSLAAKLESGQQFRGLRKISSKRLKLSTLQVITHEQLILNALNFCVPVQNSRLLLLLELSRQWNLYLRQNSRLLKLPLHLLQIGSRNPYETNNLKAVCYLLDIVTLTMTKLDRLDVQPQLQIMAAFVIVGALNCCRIEEITSPRFVLVRFAKGFLRKCYPKVHEPELLFRVLEEMYQAQLWKKVALIPPHPRLPETADSELESGWQWLEELQLIPFQDEQ